MGDDAEQGDAAEEAVVVCPRCEGEVQVRLTDEAVALRCPHCGQEFRIDPGAGMSAREPVVSVHTSEQAGSQDDRDDLDGLRIRKISNARRALYRSRSWCLIGMIVAGVGAIQSAWNGIQDARQFGMIWTVPIYAAAALACGWGAWRLYWGSRRLEAEAKGLRGFPADDGECTPDFSSLNDGSQYWRGLEQMSGDDNRTDQSGGGETVDGGAGYAAGARESGESKYREPPP